MGMVQTVWSGAGQFMDNYYGIKPEKGEFSQVKCFKEMFAEIQIVELSNVLVILYLKHNR